MSMRVREEVQEMLLVERNIKKEDGYPSSFCSVIMYQMIFGLHLEAVYGRAF